MRYYEDMTVGEKASFGRYEVTREDVLDFARKFDPQAFHLDDEAAAKTHFGRLAASGWHTAAIAMRMIVENMEATGQVSMGGGGVDELKWLKPVYPGDTLRLETELLEKRVSAKRPEMGIFRSRTTVINQHDEPVMSHVTTAMVATRPKD